MKKDTLVFVCLLLAFVSKAQTGFYLTPGAKLVINANAKLFTDSLVLIPSTNLVVTGPLDQTRTTSLVHPGLSSYIPRVYQFTNTIAAFSGDITMLYRNAEAKNFDENSLTLNIYDNTNWKPYASNVTRDTVKNIVTTSNLSNVDLRELTLTGTSILPLRFVSLNNQCQDAGVNIEWTTAEEKNVYYFDVEKSTDAVRWFPIAKIPFAAQNGRLAHYSFLDKDPTKQAFYRIVSNDFDGQKSYSLVTKATCNNSEVLSLYPNPVHEVAKLSIRLEQAATVSIEITDIKGQLMSKTVATLHTGFNTVSINTGNLPSGIYQLVLHWNDSTKSLQITKQ